MRIVNTVRMIGYSIDATARRLARSWGLASEERFVCVDSVCEDGFRSSSATLSSATRCGSSVSDPDTSFSMSFCFESCAGDPM
jgi:hypothetical protein